MNKAHEMCGSDEWRQAMREVILPWALGDTDLGDDVLEVGPGYGATTDVLSQAVPRLTSVEIDDELAAMLTRPLRRRAVGRDRQRRRDVASVRRRQLLRRGVFHDAAPRSDRSNCRTGCSPRWPGCCGPARRWSPATAWAATSSRPTTRATPTTPSTPPTLPDRLGGGGFRRRRGAHQPFRLGSHRTDRTMKMLRPE